MRSLLVLAVVVLSSAPALAQSQTWRDPNGDYTTRDASGGTWQTWHDPNGDSTTYGPGGRVIQNFRDPNGDFSSYGDTRGVPPGTYNPDILGGSHDESRDDDSDR